MLRGSRPVGVRLVATVVAAERAGRVGQRPRHCRWPWLTCAVDLDRTGPDVSRQKAQCIHMPGPDRGTGKHQRAGLLVGERGEQDTARQGA